MNDKQKMIVTVLREYGCSTAADIARLVNKRFAQTLTPASISGTIRAYIARGLMASADNGNNKKVYWITDFGKEYFK
jgi:DNA-binding PadR family transcriptional regulator